jgi:hypothetical protein
MATNSGPVDVVLLKFPGNHFKGEVLPALRDLVVKDIIRIIDLLLVFKDENGRVSTVELAGLGADLEPVFVGISGQFEGGLLDASDADEVAPDLEPNSSMAILAVENRWLIPFIGAVVNAGGEVVDQARVPFSVVDEVKAAAEGAS